MPGVVDVVGVDVGVDVLADRPVVPVLVLPLHRVPVLGKKAKLKYFTNMQIKIIRRCQSINTIVQLLVNALDDQFFFK